MQTETRYYQDAINKLKLAVSCWNTFSLSFCVNLGDIIDGRNRKAGTTEKAWKECSEEFSKLLCNRRFDMVGNHELYCWGSRQNMPKDLNIRDSKGCGWYAYQPTKGWRVLILDSFVQSVIVGSESREETLAFLKTKNPNDIENKNVEWTKDLPSESMHYLPFNGGLGEVQRGWMAAQLEEASRKDERVLIFTHVEVLRTRMGQKTLLFDHEEVTKLLEKYHGVVHTIFTGHRHSGTYYYHKKLKVHCYSILCPLVAAEGMVCHAVCHVQPDGRIEVEGFGEVNSMSLL